MIGTESDLLLNGQKAKLSIENGDSTDRSPVVKEGVYQIVLLSDVEFIPASTSSKKKRIMEQNLWFVLDQGLYNPDNEIPGGVDSTFISAVLRQMREGQVARIRLEAPLGTLSFQFSCLETDETARDIALSYREALALSNGTATVRNAHSLMLSDPGVSLAPPRSQECWVDRSQYIPLFVAKGQSVFLRCRRFGKSVFLQTLCQFFKTPDIFKDSTFLVSRMAFKADQLDSDKPLVWNPSGRARFGSHYFPPCPVAAFDFSDLGGSTTASITRSWKELIDNVYQSATPRTPALVKKRAAMGRASIDISTDRTLSACLRDMITWLSEESPTGRIVLVVDEYDAFLNENRKKEHFLFIKDLYEEFFRCLKARAKFIVCSVVTGVTRWSLDSLFSGANQLYDMTLKPFTASLCGLTEEEVSIILGTRFPEQKSHLMELFRKTLNGYRFSPYCDTTVYSPFYFMHATGEVNLDGSVRSNLRDLCVEMVEGAWWHAGASVSVTFKDLPQLLRMPTSMLVKDLKRDDETTRTGVAAKLFFCGFCTIVGKSVVSTAFGDATEITLDFPNEVTKAYMKSDLFQALVREGVSKDDETKFSSWANEIGTVLRSSPPLWSELFRILNDVISAPAANPQTSKTKRSEDHYRILLTVITMFYRSTKSVTEEMGMRGRSDLQFFVRRPDGKCSQVVFELKVCKTESRDQFDETANAAVQQIKTRNYAHNMRSLDMADSIVDVYCMGIVFSSKRGIIDTVEFDGGLRYHAVPGPAGRAAFDEEFLGHEYYSARLDETSLKLLRPKFDALGFNLLSFIMARESDIRAADVPRGEVPTVMTDIARALPSLESIVACRRMSMKPRMSMGNENSTKTVVQSFVGNSGHVETLMQWLSKFTYIDELPAACGQVSLGLRLAFKAVQYIHKAMG